MREERGIYFQIFENGHLEWGKLKRKGGHLEWNRGSI